MDDQRKKPGTKPGFLIAESSVYLDGLNVLGLEALGAAHDIKLYFLAFLQAAEAIRIDRGKVNEDILVVILARNKAKTLGVVKPLDCTLFHFGVFLCIDIR
ncbi:MAG TPA: hypothetical protein VMA71_09760 [Alloacidobacterium sp.]|nr:hypothetical protein [Alloacidobacterium sp.]